MPYDFENYIPRLDGGSFKWDDMLRKKPDVDPTVIPFSVADMELPNPPEIVAGLKEFLDSAILGYAGRYPGYMDSIKNWLADRHGWEITDSWLVETNGVVPALFSAVTAYTEPGDGVIVLTPVYYPFFAAITTNSRSIVEVPLQCTQQRRYEIDFSLLEKAASESRNKLLILCNPHNPVGRVWRRDELEKVADICLRHGVFILSDEIHSDLIMPGNRHIPFAILGSQYLDNCLVAMAPSKTFNLAGVQSSYLLIPDRARRKKFEKERSKAGLIHNNIFAYKATEIAYTRCAEWLSELIALIDHNFKTLKCFMAEKFSDVYVHDLEGTYLAWLDFRKWGMDPADLEKFMINECSLFLDEGYIFGDGGKGFERFNIACPTHKLLEGLERLHRP
jgi:Bifunctional PLP-dependent enzyme with beta-cystathionase and maltose regulon repressor activities